MVAVSFCLLQTVNELTSPSYCRIRVKSVVTSVEQDRFPLLHHPGSVVQLVTRSNDNSVRLVTCDTEHTAIMAENLEIFETMVSDHIHTAYRDNFNKVYC